MQDSIINLSKFNDDEGVFILSPIISTFEDIYLKVREKENRIHSDSELILLPFASSSNPHKKEWDLRAKSFQRFNEYLKTKKPDLNILDLGCGNGWFCGQLLQSVNHHFYCIDVNLHELRQGRKVFKSKHLYFIYADIFSSEIPEASFDIITVNAAVQYFFDLKSLIERLLALINENGEVHIIDSPIYSNIEAPSAKKRTIDYYSSIGYSEMADNYYHHTWDEFSEINLEVLYQPGSLKNKIKRMLLQNDSPFPWIVIRK